MKTILIDAVNCFFIKKENGFGVFEEMRSLLDSFPNRKIILTGANKEESRRFGLNKAPYEIFTLNHDPEKTDSSYFKKMLLHFDLRSDDVVFFEHNPEAVKSAQTAGIRSFYFDAEKNDLDGLKSFLLENL